MARGADDFVAVTPYLQVTGQERVFALGDVADADHKMAGIAGRQAQVVAANIKALISGEDLTLAYARARRRLSSRSGRPEARASGPWSTSCSAPSS